MKSDDQVEGNEQIRIFLKFLGVLSIILFAIIPFQAAIYFIAPPPNDVISYFDLFQKNPLLGFIDFDLNLTVDNILFVLVYIGLFLLLKKRSPVFSMIGLVFSIISVALYVVSREAIFGMLILSNQYASAVSEVDKVSIITNGKMLMTLFNGTSFNVSYCFGGIAITMFSIAIINSRVFSKSVGWLGLVIGILMLVPPTAGQLGFVISFISIMPMLPWLIMLAIGFFKLGKKSNDTVS
ncbi:DUF4386 family protein [Caldilinea sp.]|uniref:DUF4386 family protein n=1 Tax=Caldilinea sp. TaxID=2293560 RepID=UPI002BDB97F6|nr:DUF4386 domain-containing protein [Anaerolineales bacterium]HQY90667.1 DUF4386 family protein [Caldilinea sp.]